MTWPSDADGDVLRRLEADGFDFDQTCVIDFNVDFQSWPPSPEALLALRGRFGSVELIEAEDSAHSCVQFRVQACVSYEVVTFTQRNASALMAPFGGVCESWGVMH